MPLTQTTTAAAITASQLRIPVTSTATGFPAVGVAGQRQQVMIDSEKMLCVQVPFPGFIDVAMRGYDGSVAVAHDVLAPVSTSAVPQDFANPAPGQFVNPSENMPDQVTLGQDQAITIPTRPTVYTITKASAIALTIASGTPANAGVTLTFIAGTAFAHTLVYTPGFLGDTTASDTLTFGSKVGASVTVQVQPTGLLAAIALATVTLG